MSFAAVVGLVALVEANSRREHEGLEDVSFVWRGLRRLKAIVVADVMTTLVAPPPSRPSPSITSIACRITAWSPISFPCRSSAF